jgi:formylmethanofuran dehydrogenase subunit E
MTMQTIDPAVERLLSDLAGMHKHMCPRQVLGVRMGLSASRCFALPLPQPGKRLIAFIETDGCFADGIAVATGCTIGHRTLRLVDQGKVAVTFADTQTGRAVRFWVPPDARASAAAMFPEARSRWQAQMEAYPRMSEQELLRAQDVALTFDLASIVGKPGQRTACGVCAEEIINQREVLQDGRPICRNCTGDRYWSPKTDAA